MISPFHRTARGLSNQAAFEGVDAIVFAEGGAGFLTIEELEASAGDATTLDAAFWHTIIRISNPTKTVRVRSVGNKTTLTAIAELIVSGAVSRAIVALDRDLDDRRGRKIIHTNVFYTYGYSWENDVFTEHNLIEVFSNLAIATNVLASVRTHMKNAAEELRTCFTSVIRLDHSLAEADVDPIQRAELERSVRPNDRNPPVILRSILASELLRVRASRPECRLGPRGCAVVNRDLHGHTVAKWWLAHAHHLLRSSLGLKMSNEVFSRLAISAYSNSASESLIHYRNMVITAVW